MMHRTAKRMPFAQIAAVIFPEVQYGARVTQRASGVLPAYNRRPADNGALVHKKGLSAFPAYI